MKIGLDNDTAQQKSDPNSVVTVSTKSLDLLTDIRSKLNTLPIEVEFFWIEGHALEKYGKESYEESLNRICDEMAKAHRLKFDRCKLPWRQNARLLQEHWSIHWNGRKMTQIDKDELYNLIFEQQANNYLLERSDLTVTALDKIDWEAASKAQTKWPLGKKFG